MPDETETNRKGPKLKVGVIVRPISTKIFLAKVTPKIC